MKNLNELNVGLLDKTLLQQMTDKYVIVLKDSLSNKSEYGIALKTRRIKCDFKLLDGYEFENYSECEHYGEFSSLQDAQQIIDKLNGRNNKANE